MADGYVYVPGPVVHILRSVHDASELANMSDVEPSKNQGEHDEYQELCIPEASADMTRDDTYLELCTRYSGATDISVDANLHEQIPVKPEIYYNGTKDEHDAVPEVTCLSETRGDNFHHLEESEIYRHEACTGSCPRHLQDLPSCFNDSLVSVPLTTVDGSTHSIAFGATNTRSRLPNRKTIRKLLMFGIRVTFILWCVALVAYICILFFRPKFIMEVAVTVAVVDVILTSLNIAYDKTCGQPAAYVSYVVLLVLTIYISSIYGVLAYHRMSETFLVICSVAYVGALILCGVFTHVRVYLVYKRESGDHTWLRWING